MTDLQLPALVPQGTTFKISSFLTDPAAHIDHKVPRTRTVRVEFFDREGRCFDRRSWARDDQHAAGALVDEVVDELSRRGIYRRA